MEMINIFVCAIVLAIFSIYAASVYRYYKDEEEKKNKRKCRLDKYNR